MMAATKNTHLHVSSDTFSTLMVACMFCECFAPVREVSVREMPLDILVLSPFTTSFCSLVIVENFTMRCFCCGGAGGGGRGGGGGGDGGRGSG